MLGFFFFFLFFVLCFTSVVFLFLPVCPFIPCCSSVAVMALRRSGHARAGIPFFPYVSGGEHRHSFGATSCWFSLPVRFSLRFSWRRTLALLDSLLVSRLLRRYAHNIWHTTYLLSGGRWRCCCLCVFFMHDIQHTWVHAASCSFCCDPLRVYFLHQRACIAWSCTCGISPPWCGSLPIYSPCLPLSALCLFRWFLAVRGT